MARWELKALTVSDFFIRRVAGRQSLFGSILVVVLSGCQQTHNFRNTRMAEDIPDAALVDLNQPEVRYAPLDPDLILKLKKSQQHSFDLAHPGPPGKFPPINVLAISGGGTHGAFDVGVLGGWTASGQRPSFDIVTGISTGAFLATFAFLGPQYDTLIRDAYLMARAEDIYRKRLWVSLLWTDAIASSRPLKKKIAEAITPQVMEEVAKAHAAGRRLYVGTTNLDTQRLVIWDMGAIASSGRPDALDLYHRIILASGSVPGFFPPVRINVQVDGKNYTELHVDGGTTTSIFVPMMMTGGDPGMPISRPGSHVFVICSGKLYADSNHVKRQIVSVTGNVLSALLHSGTRSDINHIFDQAFLSGMDCHLMAIPQAVTLNRNSLAFNPKELRMLYELGYEMGRSTEAWRETPPGLDISEQTLPRTGTNFTTLK